MAGRLRYIGPRNAPNHTARATFDKRRPLDGTDPEAAEGQREKQNYERSGRPIGDPSPDPVDMPQPNGGHQTGSDKVGISKPLWKSKWVKKATNPMGLYTFGLLVLAGAQVYYARSQTETWTGS